MSGPGGGAPVAPFRGSLPGPLAALPDRLDRLMTPRARRSLDVGLWVVAGLGYLFGFLVLFVASQDAVVIRNGVPDIVANGSRAWDAYSTWLASQHLQHGETIYATGPNPGIGQIYYPPIYIQVTAPLGLLPWPVFAILARVVEFLALRGITGSWRATGIWLLFPPVVMEVNIGNVVLLTALGASLALRGVTPALPFAAIPKFAPALAFPATWRLWPRRRRALVVAIVVAGAATAISYLAAPDLWRAWVDSVRRLREYGDVGVQQGFDSGFFPRLAVALVLVALSFWPRWPLPRSTALLATFIGLPALRDASWAILAGIPLLLRHDLGREPARGPDPEPIAATRTAAGPVGPAPGG